jgi:hypothetical protein
MTEKQMKLLKRHNKMLTPSRCLPNIPHLANAHFFQTFAANSPKKDT